MIKFLRLPEYNAIMYGFLHKRLLKEFQLAAVKATLKEPDPGKPQNCRPCYGPSCLLLARNTGPGVGLGLGFRDWGLGGGRGRCYPAFPESP